MNFFDSLEQRAPETREASQFSLLPDLITRVKGASKTWAAHLEKVDPATVNSREALSQIPVLRKSELVERQASNPPLGEFTTTGVDGLARLFASPGPIYEPQGKGKDFWRAARALHAAGFRSGDIAYNTFSYHLTPGGWIMDSGLRALGCVVVPGGVGNTDQQLEAMAHLKPAGYVGVPDFLKILLDKAADTSLDLSSIKKALVSGGALFPSLRQEYADRGVKVLQAYATADLGLIAYESEAMEGMIIDEGIIVEIVKPGTGEPVPEGDVGEVLVTNFNSDYPLIRFATGDLSAVLSGQSPCGRTNMRIKGWMGRADQTTKIKGMFVHPSQINEIAKRHQDLGRLRLVVARSGEQDEMTLRVEAPQNQDGMADKIAATLKDVTKLSGKVDIVAAGELPNDGLVIADERDYS